MKTSTDSTKSWPTYALILLGICALTPILAMTDDIWDSGQFHNIAIRIGRMDILKTWAFESRWILQYYLYLTFDAFQRITGLPYTDLSNIISVASVLGICVETYRIGTEKLKISKSYAQYALAIILVYPALATLLCSVLTLHILCVWCFLFSTRLAKRSFLAALPFFLVSLSVNSVFAFAVGYICFEKLLTVNATNWKQSLKAIFLFSLSLTVLFAVYRIFFAPYGAFAGYNSFNPNYTSIIRYCLVAIAALLATHYILARNFSPAQKEDLMRRSAACFLLFFFACFAYWYVGKPVKILGTNAFTPRNAYLASVPFSLMLAIYFEALVNRFGKKKIAPIFFIVAAFLFCYQYAAYQQKFAHLLYRDMYTAALKKIQAPDHGFLILKTDKKITPKYFRDFESVNLRSLYDAYGDTNWLQFYWNEKDKDQIPERYANIFDKKNVNLFDVRHIPEGQVYTTIIRFDLKNFDPFGSPITTYDYFTKNYERYSPQVTVEKRLPPR
ncbi:hypothetical protein [Pseudodesulfovibrio sp.]|uniref:hypothetical protein n=1 Tax=unclassified Pseudodesulfovibrio TaxID=2661612 RepID=UPI003AFFDF26